MLFSQRHGLKPVKDQIQIKSMDDDLRNGLWNVLTLQIWDGMSGKADGDRVSRLTPDQCLLLRRLWGDFYKLPLDTMPWKWSYVRIEIRSKFFASSWNEVYDLLEALVRYCPQNMSDRLIARCNLVLEKEVSGYRFIDGRIAPITQPTELICIENAISDQTSCKSVRSHISDALAKFADRQNPDYRNSIKESISAVEAMARAITGDEKATLGKALDAIERSGVVKLNKALKQGYDKIYGYTSDAAGIRHSMTEVETGEVEPEDALYMLVACSAFVNYLTAKCGKAGVKLQKSG